MSLTQRLARPEIVAMQAYGSARSLAPDQGILLNANENPWPSDADPGLGLNRYPSAQPQALVACLSNLYDAPAERLLITRGSDEGIDLLVRAFCTAGADRVAICPPCFGMYEIAARIQGAGIDRFPLLEAQGFLPDFSQLGETTAKIVFLCTPNNPTGNLLPRDAILSLAQKLAERALVVVDEAYVEFTQSASLCGDIEQYPNLVVLRTLSKAWALAGARLGVLIADAEVVALLRKVLAPYPLPKPTIATALAVLTPTNRARMREQVERLCQERERLRRRLSALPQVECVYPSQANFLLLKVGDAKALVAAAAGAGILLRNQSEQAGLTNCVRISVGLPEENDALLRFLEHDR